jgi:hypothetical protein
MGLTVESNDPIGTLVGKGGCFVSDMEGLVSGTLRGTTDADITAIVLRDETGVLSYTYPAAGGGSLTTSTTAP